MDRNYYLLIEPEPSVFYCIDLIHLPGLTKSQILSTRHWLEPPYRVYELKAEEMHREQVIENR